MAFKHCWKTLVVAGTLFLIVATLIRPHRQEDSCPTIQEILEREEQKSIEIGSGEDAQAGNTGVDKRDENRLKCLLELKQEVKNVIGPYLKNRNALLLDQVFHLNIGDSFIQYGEHLLLADFGSPVRIPCTLARHFTPCNRSQIAEAISSDPKDALLLIHGGGNFGDLYPGHRFFINQYVQHFPTTPFLAMPQSVHYTKMAAVDHDARVRAKHPNFQLLARDLPSLDAMRKWFPSQVSKLCPDTAQYIGPVDRAQCRPSVDVLFLTRADGEKVPWKGRADIAAAQLRQANLTYMVVDWHNHTLMIEKHKMQYPRKPLDFPKFRSEVGIKLLCEGRMIVSDRLHATIMAGLMGLPHVYLDNSYGKIHSYRAAIYQPRPHCSDKNLRAFRAESWQQAVRIVKRVFEQDPPR